MPASFRNGSAASGQVDQGQRYDVFSHEITCSPSCASVTTKWWKSSSSSETTTPGSAVCTRIRRRYASASRSKSGCALMPASRAGMTSASGYVTMAFVAPVIDSDQHLYETRTTWLDHIDPSHRDDALRIVDDDLGYPWLSWGTDRKLGPVDVQHPGLTSELGRSARAHPRRLAARVALRRRPAARLLGRGRPRRPARGDGRRRGGGVPELRSALGAHARRGSRRAHRQHDRVEPLVRIGRGRRSRSRPSGRAPHLARRSSGSRASSPTSNAPACTSR